MLITAALCAVLALAAQLPGSAAFVDGGLRMVGGDVVTDAETFSYQVALRPARSQGGSNIELPVCSGVLIKGVHASNNSDAYWILTSATCALSGTSYKIYLGTNRVLPSTIADGEVNSDKVIIHPGYLTSFQTDDLALIPDLGDLTASITSLTKPVKQALLPNLNDAGKSYLASSVSMTGWGYPNDVFDAPSTTLRRLSSRVVPNLYCQAVHIGKPISGKHLCTGGLINKGPCTGDSGAPLVYGGRVIGLATLTPTSGCSKGKPGVFTRLGSYLSWITKVTGYDPEL